MAYLEPGDLRAKPWNVTPEEADDAELGRQIAAAQEYIEQACGMRFEPEAKILLLAGNGKRILFLPERAVSVSAVRVDGAERTGWTCRAWYLEAGPDWWFDCPEDGAPNVEIEGTFGWFAAVPQAIRDVCARLVVRALRPQEAVGVYRSERAGGRSYEVQESPLAFTGDREIDRVLLAYRRNRFRLPAAVSGTPPPPQGWLRDE